MINFSFHKICKKNSSQKGLSSINMYKFQSKCPSYGNSHDIVYDKVTIYGTLVHLRIRNNGAKLGYQIIFINIIFHFLSAKNDIFCEASIRNMVQSVIHSFLTQSSTYFVHNLQILWISLFIPNFANLDDFMPIYLK